MRTLYLDPFSGVSGDMFLGLLGDLGLNHQDMQRELKRLSLSGWQLDWRQEQRMGISGTRALVQCKQQSQHRHWQEIDALLAQSNLPPVTAQLARKIFRTLGEAEAKVHHQPLEAVHFHEVGALDALIDITGAAIGLQLLGIEQVISAPLPINHGFVEMAHGRLPLPAPAVVALLEGHPITPGCSDKELVTPTGAAIVVSIAQFATLPEMTLQRVGYGVGGRELTDRPNLLRGFLGTTPEEPTLERDEISVLQCHLDDCNPEWLGRLMEQLLLQGALDVTFSPVQMKKNRPGQLLTILAPQELEEALARLALHESSAIGIRSYRSNRYKLLRKSATITTPVGEVAIKLLYDGDQLVRFTPEFESCRKLADTIGRPLPEIYRLTQLAGNEQFSSLLTTKSESQ